MNEVITSILPHAVAVALSPIPIAALILVLLSNRARENSVFYLLGWVIALIVNVGFFSVAYQILPASGGSKSLAYVLLSLLLGIGLIFLALKQWQKRPKHGEEPQTPKWMAEIETFTPLKSFVLAFTLVTINAKNTIVNISAGITLGKDSTSLTELITGLTVFTTIGSLTIAVPVIAFLIYGDRLKGELKSLKDWFIYNSATILFVLFLILGASIISKAFNG